MAYPDQEHCERCGKPIPQQPEDACPEEMLCEDCYASQIAEGPCITEDRMFFCYVDNTIVIESDDPITEADIKQRAEEKLYEIIRRGEINWQIEEE
jgi:hypothetical protein